MNIIRKVLNTRTRDYYDIYILVKTKWSFMNAVQLIGAISQKLFDELFEKYYWIQWLSRLFKTISHRN